ncbi:MAG: 50S ribosomal protein L20 [Patescibacteria group bacterium]|nr:50S ribosomal protein L20 [Patescibacteria group bacterium]
MRVKGGFVQRRKHKKVLKRAKGYFGARSKLFRRAQEAVLHAGQYAFAGRKDRKSNFRRLWIMRINAALEPFGVKYSQFLKNLGDKKIKLDRKIMAELALKYPQIFEQLVSQSK